MKTTLLLAPLVLSGCATLAAPSQAVSDSESGPGQVVRELYDLVTFGPGEVPDWNRVRSLFLQEAVIVLRTGPDEMTVFDLDGFVNDFVQFIVQAGVQETGFSERVLDLKATEFGAIAQVLVRFDSHIPGSGRVPREGIDSFELIRQGDRWQIVSIINDRPTGELPIPGGLF
jgi:hypothetical protein